VHAIHGKNGNAVIFRCRIFRLPNFLLPIFLVAVFSVVFSVFVVSDNFVLLFFPTMAIFVAEFSHCPIFREPFLPLPFFLLPFFQLPFLPFTGALQND